MKLSAEQYADLAASFNPGYRKAADQERRGACRLELAAHLVIRGLDGEQVGDPVSVEVLDFSSHGLAAISADPMHAGAQFIAELARQSGGCVSMLCTVKHSRPMQKTHRPDRAELHVYKIGAEFTCVLGQHPGARPTREALGAELRRVRAAMPR